MLSLPSPNTPKARPPGPQQMQVHVLPSRLARLPPGRQLPGAGAEAPPHPRAPAAGVGGGVNGSMCQSLCPQSLL